MKDYGRFIYDGSKNCADLLYLTGFLAEDPFLYVSIHGNDYIIVSAMELERARKQCKESVTPMTAAQAAEKWEHGNAKLSISNLLAAIARKEKLWNWHVNSDCPFCIIDKLRKTRLDSRDRLHNLSGCKFDFAIDETFCPSRVCKSSTEAEAVRKSEQKAEAGLSRAIQILREATVRNDGFLHANGEVITAEMLRGEINAEISRLRATATGTICAPGLQSADPHQVGTGPVPANAPIVFDIFPRDDDTGYFGDLSRTVVKGKASAIVKKAFTAVYDAQRKAIEMLKPDVPCKDVHKKAAEVMESYGFKTDLKAEKPYGFIHSLGHGVGLEIHEAPSLSPRSQCDLREGHIVTVEPGLYYPEWGGIRIEDTLYVTSDGYEDLATAEVFLEIE